MKEKLPSFSNGLTVSELNVKNNERTNSGFSTFGMFGIGSKVVKKKQDNLLAMVANSDSRKYSIFLFFVRRLD